MFTGFIAKDFDNCIDNGEFPDDVKHADVTPVYKKKDKSDKTNYRPVSILTNISKIYESINNFIINLMTYYLLVSVVFTRDTVRSIAYMACQKKLKNLWAKKIILVF